jgi:hypothetical protein
MICRASKSGLRGRRSGANRSLRLIPDIRDLPDETTTAAITSGNCVVSHGPISQTTLFHEFVHVEQYREFGIQRFADLYLRGFLNAGSYFEIPLKRIAYTLGERFENNPARPFPVPVAHTLVCYLELTRTWQLARSSNSRMEPQISSSPYPLAIAARYI